MTKPDVLMLHPLRDAAMAQLRDRYTLHRWDEAADKPAFLAEAGPLCRAAVGYGHAPLDAAMIDALPALEIVSCASAGYDTFDVAALARRGIALTNASPALCDDVADTAIMLLLAARRGLIPAHAHVKSGDWGAKGAFPLQTSLSGRVLGVVGMGTIGQAIATRAAAMGQDVRYWNRSARDVAWTRVDDLTDLARQCDALIVIVAGGAGTQDLIDAAVIAALGPQGLLVNVARGSVVDEAALIAALSDGTLGHAALDVFASEPHVDPRLTALDNVTLYPHHASGTATSRDAMAQMAVDNLDAHFANRPLVSPVDLARAPG
ncbi:Lactate dehydrogenase [Loktanella fryxellensis]|uniref:Lactate dehydrogenase n=1 Tax=Loktanella fryxellensis TaxID=245187 RepID=A0A1H8A8N5_9RHOB|nr:2-hydroxyacid dehydrogenase [Loktanella fryxellensis]SEM66274.1 Lactate dehydrogenase [Loktanella fryxellensis]